MKHILAAVSVFITLTISVPAFAVIIYECVDDEGNQSFRDRCPDGATPVNEYKIYTGPKEADLPDVEITFYTVPSCDACDVVRNVLDKYGAQYDEKNVKQNIDLQRELQEKTGEEGTLSVPTVIIGEKMIIGHNKQNLVSALEEVGFKLPEAEEEESAPEGPFTQ